MSRPLSATIANATGAAREGASVEFVNGTVLSALTDAGGVFVLDLETGTPYVVAFSTAVQIDGVPYPAGSAFTIVVPEGEGVATFAECITETRTGSVPALLAALDALTARVTALEGV